MSKSEVSFVFIVQRKFGFYGDSYKKKVFIIYTCGEFAYVGNKIVCRAHTCAYRFVVEVADSTVLLPLMKSYLHSLPQNTNNDDNNHY